MTGVAPEAEVSVGPEVVVGPWVPAVRLKRDWEVHRPVPAWAVLGDPRDRGSKTAARRMDSDKSKGRLYVRFFLVAYIFDRVLGLMAALAVTVASLNHTLHNLTVPRSMAPVPAADIRAAAAVTAVTTTVPRTRRRIRLAATAAAVEAVVTRTVDLVDTAVLPAAAEVVTIPAATEAADPHTIRRPAAATKNEGIRQVEVDTVSFQI